MPLALVRIVKNKPKAKSKRMTKGTRRVTKSRTKSKAGKRR